MEGLENNESVSGEADDLSVPSYTLESEVEQIPEKPEENISEDANELEDYDLQLAQDKSVIEKLEERIKESEKEESEFVESKYSDSENSTLENISGTIDVIEDLNELKEKLDEINKAVQKSEMKQEEAEEKTKALEKEIYEIEASSHKEINEDETSESKETVELVAFASELDARWKEAIAKEEPCFVKIKRTSGEIEDDWYLTINEGDGFLRVTKQGDEISKSVSLTDLKELNYKPFKPTEVLDNIEDGNESKEKVEGTDVPSPEELVREKGITEATDFRDLIVNHLSRFDDWKYSDGSPLDKDKLIQIVNSVILGEREINYVTNRYGLRTKVSQLLQEQVNSSTKNETKEGVKNELTSEESVDVEKNSERAEYLDLKKEYKEAKDEYYAAISEEYSNRGAVSKIFGLGRQSQSSEVQEAHDKFMSANNAYYKFAQSSGVYQKVNERLNRERSEEQESLSVNPLVADRHVLSHAEQILERQTSRMPEGVARLKDNIINKIKTHPKTAIAVGGVVVALNPAMLATVAVGTSAGFASRYLGGQMFVKGRKENVENIESETIDKINELDLEEQINEAFKAKNSHQRANTTNKAVAVGAAMTAGGVAMDAVGSEVVTAPEFEGISSADNKPLDDAVVHAIDELSGPVVPENLPVENNMNVPEPASITASESVSPPDGNESFVGEEIVTEENILSPEISETDIESTYEVKSGENLSSVLLESARERIISGELKLPPGVTEESLSHYMYQSFPEMTSATDISPRLSPEEWRELGVSSGDPHKLSVGETIDMETLVDKMWGSSINPDYSATEGLEIVDSDGVDADLGGKKLDLPKFDVEGVDVYSEGELNEVPVVGSVGESVNPVTQDVSPLTGPDSTGEVSPVESTDVDVSASESASVEVNEVPLESVYQISPEYDQMTYTFGWGEGTHEYLTEVIEKGIDSGDITLPTDMVFGEYDFSENIAGLVEIRLPEVSRSLGNWDPDALTSAEWEALGLEGGNPKSPDGSTLDVGKLLNYILSGDKSSLLVTE